MSRLTASARSGVTVIVILVLIGLAFIAVIGDVETPLSGLFSDRELTVLLLAVAIGIGILIFVDARSREPGEYRATLSGTLHWLPWVAALVTSWLYLAPFGERELLRESAVPIGILTATLAWLAFPLVDRRYASAQVQSPGWTQLLGDRIEALLGVVGDTTRVRTCVDPAQDEQCRDELRKSLERVRGQLKEKGIVWVTRDGFHAAWTEVHRVEQQLVDVYRDQDLTGLVLDDVLRLRGSSVPDREDKERTLRLALRDIDPDADRYLQRVDAASPEPDAGTAPVPPPQAPTTNPATTPSSSTAPSGSASASKPTSVIAAARSRILGRTSATPPTLVTPTTPADHAAETPAPACIAQARARAVIRTIHGSILTYRGGLWAELARARWLLLRTSAVAGLVAYLILALALLFGISEIHFGTAWAYFLTGAVAGLFLRLRSAGTETEVSDDYGLEAARLYTTPLLSGMAAVIGVIIMASIAGSTLGDILDPAPEAAAVAAVASPSPTVSPSPSPSPSAGPSVSPSPSIAPSLGVDPEASGSSGVSESTPPGQSTTERLEDAFDLRHYPVGLVIALIFGLTPGLVLDRLGASLGNTKSALVTSRATRPT